jgi:hypothetical protein
MQIWHAYLDESYNAKTFCVGGFLAPEGIWRGISHDWSERIGYENRRSVKKGFKPISRYHATDCAHLKREFSENNGWDIPRQIKLTKRLCEILGAHGPTGIVVGGGISDVENYINPDTGEARSFLYSSCFKTCLLDIAALMREHVFDARVKVFYERGEFESLAKEAFDMFKRDDPGMFRCLVSAEPAGWETCVPLQTADFMAYQGFLRVDGSLKGKDAIRKSLQGLINKELPLSIVHFTDANFADIMKMIENKKAGRPIAEGVESGFQACVDDIIPYIYPE